VRLTGTEPTLPTAFGRRAEVRVVYTHHEQGDREERHVGRGDVGARDRRGSWKQGRGEGVGARNRGGL